jgi:hypothetical protein
MSGPQVKLTTGLDSLPRVNFLVFCRVGEQVVCSKNTRMRTIMIMVATECLGTKAFNRLIVIVSGTLLFYLTISSMAKII